MSQALQRAQVKVILAGASGVGAVHDYERMSEDPGGVSGFFERHFVRDGKVNGWVVLCKTLQPIVHTCSEDENRYQWTMRGYLSAEDSAASKKTAEELVDTIVMRFAARPRLNSTATWSDKPEADEVTTGMIAFGEHTTKVHVMTIRFVSQERTVITYV